MLRKFVEEHKPNPKTEKAVTKATAVGALSETALGFGLCNFQYKVSSSLSSNALRMIPIQRIPFSLGVGCFFAFYFIISATIFQTRKTMLASRSE